MLCIRDAWGHKDKTLENRGQDSETGDSVRGDKEFEREVLREYEGPLAFSSSRQPGEKEEPAMSQLVRQEQVQSCWLGDSEWNFPPRQGKQALRFLLI